MLRDDLLKLQETKGDKWITIDDLPNELKYIPVESGGVEEIFFNKIEGILYEYDLQQKKAVVNQVTKRKAVVKFKIGSKKTDFDKWEKFVDLAKPDENGHSRIVTRAEFEAIGLKLGNGGDFCRKSSKLYQLFKFSVNKTITKGNSIDEIQLQGYNEDFQFKQHIASWIREKLEKENCVMLGCNGTSENTRIEIDHKDGRKEDTRLSDPAQQKITDFQPLCKAANDVKREICKKCKENNKRWNAKNIKGNPYDFYEGDENYTENLGCVGCYQYDPVEYRVSSAKKLAQETLEYIMDKIYPEFKDNNNGTEDI